MAAAAARAAKLPRLHQHQQQQRRQLGPTSAAAGAAAVAGAAVAAESTSLSELQEAFAGYAHTLDATNEKRERIVKASRDITIYSKKAIFAVHRADSGKALANAGDQVEGIRRTHVARVAQELTGDEYHRFRSSFGWGLQEYVEAATFLCFCESGGLLSLHQLNQSFAHDGIHDADSRPFAVAPSEYVLGVADLTGEVMRLAVSGRSTFEHTNPEACRRFVQSLHAAFLALPRSSELTREFGKKMEVMRQSAAKIENVAYALKVRGSEYPAEFLLGAVAQEPEHDAGES